MILYPYFQETAVHEPFTVPEFKSFLLMSSLEDAKNGTHNGYRTPTKWDPSAMLTLAHLSTLPRKELGYTALACHSGQLHPRNNFADAS